MKSRSKCLPKLESTHSHYGANHQRMINQPTQTTNLDTAKLDILENNQLLILKATSNTTTAFKLNNNHQSDPIYDHLALKNYPNMIFSDMKKGNVFRGFSPLESEFQEETVSTMRVIGEDLNTPVINTQPEFNLYRNSRSTQSLKQQLSGSMLDNNNTITISNYLTVNNSSTTNTADTWYTKHIDIDDCQPHLFSPTYSTKSSKSPSGLNSSDLLEESFIYETNICDTNLPVKYSQDYEDFAFVDEINLISKSKEFNTADNFALKIESDDLDSPYESNSLETKTVLYHDTMITGLEPPTMLIDEDSYLVTVKNFNDILIKPDKKSEVIVSNINRQKICEKNLSDYFLTPAPSPKSPIPCERKNNGDNNCNNNFDECEHSSDCLNPVNDMYQTSSPAEDRLQLEHNYNININPYNNRIDETNSLKRKLVTDSSPSSLQVKRAKRVSPLKLKIPTNMRTLRQDSVKIDVNTPDITNYILELEDKFDLVKYITSSQDTSLTESTVELIDEKSNATTTAFLDLESIINKQCPIPTKRPRVNSYENPDSVQSVTSTIVSDDSSTAPTLKRRGRPPKTECTLPSPSAYRNLSESDWKYMEMRNKNNEASRRSRINRKDRENQIETEARYLEDVYKKLSEEETALMKQVAKWRRAVMKLAQI